MTLFCTTSGRVPQYEGGCIPSGIGNGAGYSAALNTVAKSFPNKTVSSSSVSKNLTPLTLPLRAENDYDRNHYTSGFLSTLAVWTAIPMVLGWSLARPRPYPKHIVRVTTEGNK
ncbi:hypothetical protein BDM02DRAFT_3115236 [Thelephora ganbajun]|uniref:Uncharacterized protein n=1 Tax=Thelephora ganbajun TaxID=370292 RepID=A0ACB6ZFS9_THEGA|nr:hypothetical protein BDM02DRAFT_3115236 [Thelephora ganbajun]